ncbi:MAG: hypothetical protein H0W68_01130, partial [Gemmatimonadaceae bacterium]|nr:hypothetical protein [Geodermatophilaceae bacterium]MBA3670610.1 hypothetical protein [Gemmatimonadaceae bacterium]
MTGSHTAGAVPLPRPGRVVRGALLVVLVASSLGPLVLLAIWSISGRWLYPALLPTEYSAASWRALGAESLGPALV